MRKLWLALGGLLAALLVGEIVCRLVTDDPFETAGKMRDSWRATGLTSDPDVDFSFEPGYEGRMTLEGEYDVPFRINGQGLRDDHDYAAEHPGTTRILLVGDSFVFGIGVELPDTLGKQLERALNAGRPARPAEVIAVGVPSYGLDAYVGVVERWMPRLQPDLVLVALYPGNDLLDYELKARDPRVVVRGMLVSQNLAWDWNLRRVSILASLIFGDLNPYPRIESHRPRRPTPQDFAHIFRTIRPLIARFAAAQRPGGPPVAITACYARESVPAWRDGALDAAVPPWNEVLAEFTRQGLRVLDPKPAWLAPELPWQDYFFARDAHYRPAGNRFLAEWLAARLQAEYPALLAPAAASAAPR